MRYPLQKTVSFIPFKKELKKYNLFKFRSDLLASLSVALLAIPQAIAYSLLAGLPPISGFYSAIFGTIFSSAWGSSKHLISGPTTGVAILLQTAVQEVLQSNFPDITGLEKQQITIQILTHIVLVIGAVQIFSAFFNVGKLLQFVSRSVVFGYFAGVAFAIFANQIYYFSGVGLGEDDRVISRLLYYFAHLHELKIGSILIGGVSLGFLYTLRRWFIKFPDALLTLVFASLLTFFLNQFFTDKYAISSLTDIMRMEDSSFQFAIPFFEWKIFTKVFSSSCAIAFVAILEVFSVSRNLATKSGQNIYSNQEVFGLGISNAILCFFPFPIPSSGSASRSSLNYLNGAKTRFAAIYSGIFVGVFVLVFWPLIQWIPLATLAALLLVTTKNIVSYESIKLCFRATRGDGIVFCLTMASCLFFDLDIAFFIGIMISLVFYLKRSAEPHQVEYAFNSAGRLTVVPAKEKAHRKIRIIGVAGELFFGTVDLFQNTVRTIAKDSHVKVIVLRLTGVYHVDASMCLAILKAHEYLSATRRHLVISGISDEVWKVFSRTNIVHIIGSENLFLSDEANPQLSTWRACLRAQDLSLA